MAQLKLALAGCVAFNAIIVADAHSADLNGAGASFPAPLYYAWIDAYKEVNADDTVTYESVGSGEGVRRLIAGEVDFGASDAAMTDEQIAEVEAGVNMIPATAGMVVLAYNIPDVPSGLKLTREALAGIFLGHIRNWNDPIIADANPEIELPNLSIQQVVRRDKSGTTFAFTNHLAAISDEWNQTFGTKQLLDWPGISVSAYYNEGVAGRINISWGSIGYVEQGFASMLDLPVASLQNAAGNFVAPSAASGAAALEGSLGEMPENNRQFMPDPAGDDAYPIVTYSWLLGYQNYEDSDIAEAFSNFATWGLTEGQALAEELGYIPLPESVANRGLEALKLSN